MPLQPGLLIGLGSLGRLVFMPNTRQAPLLPLGPTGQVGRARGTRRCSKLHFLADKRKSVSNDLILQFPICHFSSVFQSTLNEQHG